MIIKMKVRVDVFFYTVITILAKEKSILLFRKAPLKRHFFLVIYPPTLVSKTDVPQKKYYSHRGIFM